MKILITGPTSGTGKYLATELASQGHELLLIGRSMERLKELKAEVPNRAEVELFQADLSEVQSVENVAKAIASSHDQIDVFISNAGTLGREEVTLTSQDLEATFMTNFLSHYLLQDKLMTSIIAAEGKIFNICSQSHEWHDLDYNDFQSIQSYQPMKAYARSKKMLLFLGLTTHKLGVTTYNIDPGTFRSGIARSRGAAFRFMYGLAKFAMRTPAQAAADVVKILSGEDDYAPSGSFLKSGKVKELPYSDEEIGKFIDQIARISGKDIRSNFV